MAKLVDTELSGSLKINPNSLKTITINKTGIKNSMTSNTVDGALTIGSADNPFGAIYGRGYHSCLGKQRYAYLRPYKAGTIEEVGSGRLTLGNDILKGNANNAIGEIFLYGENNNGTLLKTKNRNSGTDKHNTIWFPASGGTVSLEGHTHPFESGQVIIKPYTTNKTKYTTEIEGRLWGSPTLDMFIVRGHCTITVKKGQTIDANEAIAVGRLLTEYSNTLPLSLVPLAVYRGGTGKMDCAAAIKGATNVDRTNDDKVKITGQQSLLIFKNCNAMTGKDKAQSYGFYFSGVYSRLGEPKLLDPDKDNSPLV